MTSGNKMGGYYMRLGPGFAALVMGTWQGKSESSYLEAAKLRARGWAVLVWRGGCWSGSRVKSTEKPDEATPGMTMTRRGDDLLLDGQVLVWTCKPDTRRLEAGTWKSLLGTGERR
jgi:hypothetical protein